MESYNLVMKGKFTTEKVENIPVWKQSDVGRIIYVTSIDKYFIGCESVNIDDDGWAIIGLYSDSIINKHVNWDENLEYIDGKISSLNIPTIYGDSTTNIQNSLDIIYENILDLSSGTLLGDEKVLARHIGFNADDIPIINNDLYFNGNDPSIEDALNQLYLRTAKDIKLSDNTLFGDSIGLDVKSNLEDTLIELEKYLINYPSSNIVINNPLDPSKLISLQICIDALYGLIQNKKLTNLLDTPIDYGVQNQFLRTNGINKFEYSDIYGDLINVQYPVGTTTTVQNALMTIYTQIENLSLGLPTDPISRDITQINAKNVIFDDTLSSGKGDNVETVLNYLLVHSYTASNPPKAIDIKSTGIGATDNIQAALEHLQEYLNQTIGLIPSCLKASDIYYNSIQSHTNVDSSLDYLFDIIPKINEIEICCDNATSKLNKYKIYYTSYNITSDFNPNGGFPVSISFDFSNWYNDYKNNFNPDVGNNFIVIPIIQLNSFVVTNVYQKYRCDDWSITDPTATGYPGVCLGDIYSLAINEEWPPKPSTASLDFYEAGTLGEYSYIYYKAGPTKYLDPDRKWSFSIDIGTSAYAYGKRDFTKTKSERDKVLDTSYSTGGDASYTILFFGYGFDSNSILKILDSYCSTPCFYPTHAIT